MDKRWQLSLKEHADQDCSAMRTIRRREPAVPSPFRARVAREPGFGANGNAVGTNREAAAMHFHTQALGTVNGFGSPGFLGGSGGAQLPTREAANSASTPCGLPRAGRRRA